MRTAYFAAFCGVIFGFAPQAWAQSAEQFYQGKAVDVVIGFGAGGGNDFYGRLLANHIGKHIPGRPNVVPKNMPGAGSFLAINTIYNVAPKDGTVIGLGAPTMALDEKIGSQGFGSRARNLTGSDALTVRSMSSSCLALHP